MKGLEMSRIIYLMLVLSLCVFFPRFTQAEGGEDPNNEDEKVVTIELTKLDVNDTTLELSYKIKNNTDHNVWICDNIHVYWPSLDFEVYLSKDDESLFIRRRLNVPTAWTWGQCPYGRYILLRSSQERIESISLDVPVQRRYLFASGAADSGRARRIILEIGFYNEDLPGMILDILKIEEKLNSARLDYSEYTTDLFIRYFEGIWISHQLFRGLAGFEKYTYKEGNEEILIPYTWQKFSGEQFLRIEVDGVNIPYEKKGGYSPPPKGRACFPSETSVWINGKIVPISKVVEGEMVHGFLPGSLTDRVEEVQEHIGKFECRDIILENGNHIAVVGDHCFMLANGKWISTQNLKNGISLRTLKGKVRIKSVKMRSVPYTGKVYNLKIKNSDMYLVGRDAIIVRDY